MEGDQATRYSPHPAVVAVDDRRGKWTLSHLESGASYVLNDTAGCVWHVLAAGGDLRSAGHRLFSRYAIEPDTAIEQARELLGRFLKADLLRPGDGAPRFFPPADGAARTAAVHALGGWLTGRGGGERPPGFWPALLELAMRFKVTPAVWSGMRQCGVEGPEAVVEHLRTLHALNAERNRAIGTQIQETVAALNQVGIEPVLLKGAASLVSDTYGDAGARAIGDIDLLVTPEQAEAAVAALTDCGFRSYSPDWVDYRDHHHLPPLVRDGSVPIEVHLEALPQSTRALLPAESIVKRSRLVSCHSLRMRVPEPTHRLLHAVVHAQITDQHLSRGQFPFRALQDYCMLRQRYAAVIDWEWVWRALGRHRPALDTLVFAGERLAQLPPPPGARLELRVRQWFWRCLADCRWPAFRPWNDLAHQLSGHQLRQTYGCGPGPLASNLARSRYLFGTIQRRVLARPSSTER